MRKYLSRFRDLGLTYLEAAHGIQTAVKFTVAKDPHLRSEGASHSPGHLRAGVNMAMVEHSALAGLLLDKGMITEDEYAEALRLSANEEVAKYEADAPRGLTFR